jgi:hypothetical protein
MDININGSSSPLASPPTRATERPTLVLPSFPFSSSSTAGQSLHGAGGGGISLTRTRGALAGQAHLAAVRSGDFAPLGWLTRRCANVGGMDGGAAARASWQHGPAGPYLGFSGPMRQRVLYRRGTFPCCAWPEAPVLDRQVQIGHHLADPRWALRGATCGDMEVTWSAARRTDATCVLGPLPSAVQPD